MDPFSAQSTDPATAPAPGTTDPSLAAPSPFYTPAPTNPPGGGNKVNNPSSGFSKKKIIGIAALLMLIILIPIGVFIAVNNKVVTKQNANTCITFTVSGGETCLPNTTSKTVRM